MKQRISEILKIDFFAANFQNNGNFCDSQTLDKTENAKNNEIKMLVLPHDSLKSQKTVSSDNGGHKYLRKCETQASIPLFLLAQKCLYFKRKVERRENSNLVKEPG